nr:MAG TPA: hypothetical protein [Caudoviricetes sp.]
MQNSMKQEPRDFSRGRFRFVFKLGTSAKVIPCSVHMLDIAEPPLILLNCFIILDLLR